MSEEHIKINKTPDENMEKEGGMQVVETIPAPAPVMQSLSVISTGSRSDTPYHKLRRASHNIISGSGQY